MLPITEQLLILREGLSGLRAELVLTGGFVFTLLLSLFKGRAESLGVPLLTNLTLLAALAVTVLLPAPVAGYFSGSLQADGLASWGIILFTGAGLLTMVLSHYYRPLQRATSGIGEYCLLLLGLVLGLCLLVKAGHFLLLFLALELVSLSSYLLTVVLPKRDRALEAGVKYVLFGAVSAGVMLYGVSLLFGFSGTLTFTDPAFGTRIGVLPPMLPAVALLLVWAGLLFKAGAAPFHVWAPDVYETAPTPIVAFFSSAPKYAAFFVMYRLLAALPPGSQYLMASRLLIGVALLSLLIGNLGALRQKSVKRLLAYSSIAHVGFLLMPLAAGVGMSTILFYATVLLFGNYGAFLFVQAMEGRRETLLITDLNGRGVQLPVMGIGMVIALVSLTGLPPTAGFTAKLLVFTQLWEQFEASGEPGLLVLLVAGILLTVVALFYYLKLPYALFFRRNQAGRRPLPITFAEAALVFTLSLPLLFFFLKPDWLLGVIERCLMSGRVW